MLLPEEGMAGVDQQCVQHEPWYDVALPVQSPAHYRGSNLDCTMSIRNINIIQCVYIPSHSMLNVMQQGGCKCRSHLSWSNQADFSTIDHRAQIVEELLSRRSIMRGWMWCMVWFRMW